MADDDVDSRVILAQVARDAGHRPLEARDGVLAEAYLKTVKVDLVLLDLHMPRMSGTELLGKMRSHSRWKTIPVVVMTGDEYAHATGADEVLRKPIDVEMLRRLILRFAG